MYLFDDYLMKMYLFINLIYLKMIIYYLAY